MERKTHKGLVLEQYGKIPVLKEVQIPALADGQLLVKVQATTINPSDRLLINGLYAAKPQLPVVCGLQGTGYIVQAKGENVQSWVGKRVSFTTLKGSWAEYSVTTPNDCFQIEKDVPLTNAASGIVNPLTVIGFVQNYKSKNGKGGIIHTAAASALGRMLNQLCQKQQIPLLNIVRRQEQAEILRKQGATHIIVTVGQWKQQLKNIMKTQGFDFVYDALGGGEVSDTIIQNLVPNSHYHIYGLLESQPITITNKASILFSGITIGGFYVFNWWPAQKEDAKDKIRRQYSNLLKKQLSTHTIKQFTFDHISEAVEISAKKSTEGKVLLKVQ